MTECQRLYYGSLLKDLPSRSKLYGIYILLLAYRGEKVTLVIGCHVLSVYYL